MIYSSITEHILKMYFFNRLKSLLPFQNVCLIHRTLIFKTCHSNVLIEWTRLHNFSNGIFSLHLRSHFSIDNGDTEKFVLTSVNLIRDAIIYCHKSKSFKFVQSWCGAHISFFLTCVSVSQTFLQQN